VRHELGVPLNKGTIDDAPIGYEIEKVFHSIRDGGIQKPLLKAFGDSDL
jgi:hypothetical protein